MDCRLQRTKYNFTTPLITMKINTLTVVSSLVVLQNATAFAVPPLGQNVVARSSTTTALAMGNPIDGENIIPNV